MKKGFTLGELLMAMLIIGIISATTIPVMTRTLGKNHRAAYKAAFTNVETVVDELMADTSLYPGAEFTTRIDFCNQFFNKVNTIGSNTCTTTPSYPFTTINGMKWNFVDGGGVYTGDFDYPCPDSAGSHCVLIRVDINGNKGKGAYTGDNEQRDILRIYVSKYGKVYAPDAGDGPERAYLN